jgi:hypothetical protein
MGTYYKGNAPYYHTLKENIDNIKKYFILNSSGYFGEVGKVQVENIRQINALNQIESAKDFYNTISYGGIESSLPNNKGVKTQLKDGTIIVYREITSTEGSPAVEINIKNSNDNCSIQNQKIHFERIF